MRHRISGDQILLTHGHQVDFLNSTLWRIARLLIRYLWIPFERSGVYRVTCTSQKPHKQYQIENRLMHWASQQRQMLICGHTHRPVFSVAQTPPYFNTGCAVSPNQITGIEIAHGAISLVRWHVKIRPDRSSCIDRQVISGPERLVHYFNRPAKTTS